jgi:hypothetical protein
MILSRVYARNVLGNRTHLKLYRIYITRELAYNLN